MYPPCLCLSCCGPVTQRRRPSRGLQPTSCSVALSGPCTWGSQKNLREGPIESRGYTQTPRARGGRHSMNICCPNIGWEGPNNRVTWAVSVRGIPISHGSTERVTGLMLEGPTLSFLHPTQLHRAGIWNLRVLQSSLPHQRGLWPDTGHRSSEAIPRSQW